MATIERRYAGATVELRADGDGQTLVGHAAVFFDGTPATEFALWDGAVERVMPGAFTDTLKAKDDVRGLFNHDPNQLLGRSSAGTLSLTVDRRGLSYSISLGDTGVARDVVQHVQRGDLKGSSFGFEITDQTWQTENSVDIREIRGVRLWDVGPVTFPAYEGTNTGLRDKASAFLSQDVNPAFQGWQAWQERQNATDRGIRARQRGRLIRLAEIGGV